MGSYDVDSAVEKSFRHKTPLSTYIVSIFRIAISKRHSGRLSSVRQAGFAKHRFTVVADVRFGTQFGLKSDITTLPKSANRRP
jgi:hypothetical protein